MLYTGLNELLNADCEGQTSKGKYEACGIGQSGVQRKATCLVYSHTLT